MSRASRMFLGHRDRHKYGVNPPGLRTYKDVVYDSTIEAVRAQELDWLKGSECIDAWERQVVFQLGPDFSTRVDFVVTNRDGTKHVEEVKGAETERFRKVRSLWKKYGPLPMKVFHRCGSKWQVSTIMGGAMNVSEPARKKGNDDGTESK